MNHHPIANTFEKLRDTDLAVADSALDIRGRTVVDRNGEKIGHISHLFIDTNERKIRMLEVFAGGFLGIGDRHFLLPVDAVTCVTKDHVHVSEARDRIIGSPVYDPTLIVAPTQDVWEPFYGYYGLSPYWGFGYMFPSFPKSLGDRDHDVESTRERTLNRETDK
jgi:sporulation protein YlmC with PRC-barrel domain